MSTVVVTGFKTLLNATPHDVVVYNQAGDVELLRIPPSGQSIRLTKSRTPMQVKNTLSRTIPIVTAAPFDGYEDPDGLLQKSEAVLVSMVVAQYLRDHHPELANIHLYVPDTGPGPMGAVRSSDGRIIGTHQLIQG